MSDVDIAVYQTSQTEKSIEYPDGDNRPEVRFVVADSARLGSVPDEISDLFVV